MMVMMMMGLSRNPRRELYTPSPSSVVRGSLSSVFPSNSSPSRGRGLIVARSRSHAPSSALYVYGSVARPRRRDRDRSSDPSIRHPSDPSDPSVRSIYPSVRSNRPENRILSPGVLYCTVYKYYVSGLMVFTGVRYKYVVRKENPRVLCISCLYT